LWHKENLINLAVQRLPEDWEYVAWLDADIEFLNKEWARETVEELQTYDVVQVFSHCNDLGPQLETLQIHTGFAYQYVNGEEWRASGYTRFFHPGFGVACTRRAWNAFGGLPDFSILGSGDHHFMLSLIGKVDRSLDHGLHPNYIQRWLQFQNRCERLIRHNLGFVHGTILHHYHGCKSQRQYLSRWKILSTNQYDPQEDIKYDSQGVLQLEDTKPRLRDQLRIYFRKRNEDACTIYQEYPFMRRHWI
jgi:hypothetical protein